MDSPATSGFTKSPAVLSVVFGLVTAIASKTSIAALAPYSVTTDLHTDIGAETHSRDQSLSLLTLQPQAKWRFGKRWRGARVELDRAKRNWASSA